MLVFAILMTLSAGAGMKKSIPIAQAAPTINLGDYIQFGTYNDVPILWRVIHQDEDGDPVLLADRILTPKAFDAAGSYHQGNSNRLIWGSNDYSDSNIRQWLNSTETTIEWIQNTPNETNLYNGYNPYSTEQGFLADGNFTPAERKMIKPITHKVLLSEADQINKIDGTENHTYNSMLSTVVQNYDTTAYFKNVTDQVFLLSVKQLKEWVYDNRSILGTNYHLAKRTPQSLYQNTFFNYANRLDPDTDYWDYWLNTPDSESSTVRIVNPFGQVDRNQASEGYVGVRPALTLNLSTTVFAEGGRGKPIDSYVVKRIGSVDSETDAQPPDAPSGFDAYDVSGTDLTLSWSASTDNVDVAGYEIYQNGSVIDIIDGSRTFYVVSGLHPGTSYTFHIRANDPTGNVSPVSSKIIQTLDTLAPTRPENLSIIFNKNGVLEVGWSASEDNVGVEKYELFLDDVKFDETELNSYYFENLVEGRRYSLYIQAYDAAENRSAGSEMFYFRVSTTEPPTAPRNLSLLSATEKGMTISWQQPASTDEVAGYLIYLNGKPHTNTMVANNTYKITGLRPYTSYRVQVSAYNQSNVQSTLSESKTFRTNDATAPTAPAKLKISQLAPLTALRLTWSPSADNGTIAGYHIYLNNKWLTTRTVSKLGNTAALTRLDLTNLSYGSHRLQVQAFDAAGNKSKLSQVINTPKTILVTSGKLYFNGKLTNLGSGFAPTIIGGQTMVPYKPFFTALGFKSKWYPGNKMVEAHSQDKKVTFNLIHRVKSMKVVAVSSNNRRSEVTVKLSAAPIVRNGQLMVPIRPIANELGYTFIMR